VKSEFILADYPKELYFNSSSLVAVASSVASDQFGNIFEGVTKCCCQYYPDSKSFHGALGKPTKHIHTRTMKPYFVEFVDVGDEHEQQW
ncbi:11585_t:CDS:2, partial [Ambispora leptoticha]